MIISPETLCGGVAVAGPGAGVGGAVRGGEEAGVAAGVAAVDRRQPAVALLALLHHAVAAETRTGDRLHQIFLCPHTTGLGSPAILLPPPVGEAARPVLAELGHLLVHLVQAARRELEVLLRGPVGRHDVVTALHEDMLTCYMHVMLSCPIMSQMSPHSPGCYSPYPGRGRPRSCDQPREPES